MSKHSVGLVGHNFGDAEPELSAEDFHPITSFEKELAPHCRDFEAVPVRLETRGITAHRQQQSLFNPKLLFKESIIAKLRSIGADDLAEPLARCHTEQTFAQCNGCHSARRYWNRCENFYCPSCQARLARDKQESITWWVQRVSQPKHVVLTVRNTNHLTWKYVRWLKECFKKLRRSKLARSWRGGLWSIETTNEGRGWHVHFHLLVDANFIPKSDLAIKWGSLVGQDFAIVEVKDVRNSDYRKEVAKYTVDGSMLASWSPIDIVTFINAFHGQRTFGVFGSLYGKRTEWRDWLNSLLKSKRACECGCDQFKFYTESEWSWKQETQFSITRTQPNAPNPQLQLP